MNRFLPAGPRAIVLLAAAAFAASALAQYPTPPPQPADAHPYVIPAPPVLSAAEQQKREEMMLEPYRVAAAIIKAQTPQPKLITQVGSFEGQFLGAFLDAFPNTPGQYTEAATSNAPVVARKKLARFGDRVSFVVGCPSRDISTGCVLHSSDVILVEWMSIHQDLDGMYKNYRAAYDQLPADGWMVTLDRVSYGNTQWDANIQAAAKVFRPAAEAPPVHHPTYRTPTANEELGAMRAAGFDVQIVWQSFSTVLFLGHKK